MNEWIHNTPTSFDKHFLKYSQQTQAHIYMYISNPHKNCMY